MSFISPVLPSLWSLLLCPGPLCLPNCSLDPVPPLGSFLSSLCLSYFPISPTCPSHLHSYLVPSHFSLLSRLCPQPVPLALPTLSPSTLNTDSLFPSHLPSPRSHLSVPCHLPPLIFSQQTLLLPPRFSPMQPTVPHSPTSPNCSLLTCSHLCSSDLCDLPHESLFICPHFTFSPVPSLFFSLIILPHLYPLHLPPSSCVPLSCLSLTCPITCPHL